MWTRTKTRRTKDGFEVVKLYDYPEPSYRGPVTNFPRKELLKKTGRTEK